MNGLSKKLNILIFVFATCLMLGCTTGQEPEYEFMGSWELIGLQHTEIKLIEKDKEGLLIGTNAGLFHWKNDTEEFIDLGLNQDEIRGVVRFSDETLLAGIKSSGFSSGDTTLFRLRQGAETWEPFVNNFGGETGEYTFISKGPLKKTGVSDTIWVRIGNAVARSTDKGNHWELVVGSWDSWGGSALLFYFDPYRNGYIWIGGVSALSQVNLYKTIDNGNNWTNVTSGLSDGTEAAAYDVITFQSKSNVILAGLSGTINDALRIRKSTDEGETWNTVYSDAGIHSFTHSVQTPEIVYASGINSEGRLFFLASDDFGDTWETVKFPDSPIQIHVNDMVSVMEAGTEVLYLGTNKGLYSYTFSD